MKFNNITSAQQYEREILEALKDNIFDGDLLTIVNDGTGNIIYDVDPAKIGQILEKLVADRRERRNPTISSNQSGFPDMISATEQSNIRSNFNFPSLNLQPMNFKMNLKTPDTING